MFEQSTFTHSKWPIFVGLLRWCACAGIIVLSACGGGGGGSTSTPASPPATNPPESIITPSFTNVVSETGVEFAVGYSEGSTGLFDIPFIAGGVAAGDYDDDGDVDLFIVRGDVGANLLYRNLGNMSFEEVGVAAGVVTTSAVGEHLRLSGPMFADIDGDGDLDLFAGGVQGDASVLFENLGDGTFQNVIAGSGLDTMNSPQTISAAFGDYDLDGDLDLLLAHWGTTRSFNAPGDTEHLWRNDSDANGIRFSSVSESSGVAPSIINQPDTSATGADRDNTFVPAMARLNDDLYPDILMVADFNTTQVLQCNGDGTFTNTTDTEVIRDTNGMGSAIADFDNDGDLDWFVTSIYREAGTVPNGNRFYRNENGVFTDATVETGTADGGWGWAACALDLENDGDLDIYHVNGWPFELNGDFSENPSRAFVSDGEGVFVDQAATIGIADTGMGRGVVCADFDNDGDTDLFLWSTDEINGASFYRNDSNGNNYLAVQLNGLSPNTEAAGARIKVTLGGVTQMREISLASNFVSQNPTRQIFGLANAAQADALSVEWPDGQMTELTSVNANQLLEINHPELP